ncbi:hypothetical protein ACIBCN_00875 [Nocardia sp. NPDC051052]|uniref:hypothetical protein n=1 Tax=Nocardia sp. NPDC051052 TaxID=3364322 RepID=UPI0037A07E0A
MSTASLNDPGGIHVLTEMSCADRTPNQQPSMTAPLRRCPYWCERPDGHDWEDDAALGDDLMRVHRHTFPIPGTDHGSFMVLATECVSRAGIEHNPMSYVVDTGLGSDGELDAAGALGLAQVLATALSLTVGQQRTQLSPTAVTELSTKPPPY